MKKKYGIYVTWGVIDDLLHGVFLLGNVRVSVVTSVRSCTV